MLDVPQEVLISNLIPLLNSFVTLIRLGLTCKFLQTLAETCIKQTYKIGNGWNLNVIGNELYNEDDRPILREWLQKTLPKMMIPLDSAFNLAIQFVLKFMQTDTAPSSTLLPFWDTRLGGLLEYILVNFKFDERFVLGDALFQREFPSPELLTSRNTVIPPELLFVAKHNGYPMKKEQFFDLLRAVELDDEGKEGLIKYIERGTNAIPEISDKTDRLDWSIFFQFVEPSDYDYAMEVIERRVLPFQTILFMLLGRNIDNNKAFWKLLEKVGHAFVDKILLEFLMRGLSLESYERFRVLRPAKQYADLERALVYQSEEQRVLDLLPREMPHFDFIFFLIILKMPTKNVLQAYLKATGLDYLPLPVFWNTQQVVINPHCINDLQTALLFFNHRKLVFVQFTMRYLYESCTPEIWHELLEHFLQSKVINLDTCHSLFDENTPQANACVFECLLKWMVKRQQIRNFPLPSSISNVLSIYAPTVISSFDVESRSFLLKAILDAPRLEGSLFDLISNHLNL